MTGYTPTTEEVREAISEWAWARRMFRPELGQSDGLEADRWLAAACTGDAWNNQTDEPTPCECACHDTKEGD